MSNKIKLVSAYTEQGYLSKFCENIFEKYNFKEEPAFKGMPERMAFETEIWMIGEELRQGISKAKKNEINQLVLEEILTIIRTVKYGKGREIFVMLLHYFKDNSTIEDILKTLLDDKQLYGFALKELNKLKLYYYKEKVNDILKNEKTSWIKKEAERYLKNS